MREAILHVFGSIAHNKGLISQRRKASRANAVRPLRYQPATAGDVSGYLPI
jgi:hypothetical protein